MANAKKKKPGPHVLTANRLRDGDVVYWTANGAWDDALDAAHVFLTPEEQVESELKALADVEARLVLEPYFFAVTTEADDIHPKQQREIIRAKGPTVRLDLGKQASVGA